MQVALYYPLRWRVWGSPFSNKKRKKKVAKHEERPDKGYDKPDEKFSKKYSGKHSDDTTSFAPGDPERAKRIEDGGGSYGHER